MTETTATHSAKANGRRPAAAPRATLAIFLSVSAAAVLGGCASTVTKHGHQFQETDLQQVSAGMSGDQVRLALGTPASISSINQGQAYYYISSTMKQTAFFEPTEIDRKVVAIYLSPTGTVERVANYGLKDGKVFDYITRTTPSANTREDGILRQLFRNLGQRQFFGE